MALNTSFSGNIQLMGEECVYQFNGDLLQIYVSDKIFQDLFWTKTGEKTITLSEKKPLAVKELLGTIQGDFTRIHFFFDPMSYGCETKGMMGEKCVLKLSISRYILTSQNLKKEGKILVFHSNQFHRFLNMVPCYSVDPIDQSMDLKAEVHCNLRETTFSSSFDLDGRKITFYPAYTCSWGGPKFLFTPTMALKIEGEVDDNFLWRLFFDFDAFIHLAFFRTNTHPDACYFCSGFEKQELVARWTSYQDEGPEDVASFRCDAIPWSVLFHHAGQLFKEIDEKSLYLNHIPANKNDRFWVSPSTIATDGAAFEQSFAALYPSGFPHSQERLNAEAEVNGQINLLEEKATGKAKDIYKGFLKHVRLEALSDKMEYALEQCASLLEQVRQQMKLDKISNENIAKNCAGLRNEIDHGTPNQDVTEENAQCFVLLRALIYTLQLKKAGYDDGDIKTALNCLFCSF